MQSDSHSSNLGSEHAVGKMTKLQMVWPKDGPKGHRPRGLFRGFCDIWTGKGPDMFLQRKNSKSPIDPGLWGNWCFPTPSFLAQF